MTQWERPDAATGGTALIYNFLITVCNDVICNRLILGRMLLCTYTRQCVESTRYLGTAASSHDLNMTRREGEINMKHLHNFRLAEIKR